MGRKTRKGGVRISKKFPTRELIFNDFHNLNLLKHCLHAFGPNNTGEIINLLREMKFEPSMENANCLLSWVNAEYDSLVNTPSYLQNSEACFAVYMKCILKRTYALKCIKADDTAEILNNLFNHRHTEEQIEVIQKKIQSMPNKSSFKDAIQKYKNQIVDAETEEKVIEKLKLFFSTTTDIPKVQPVHFIAVDYPREIGYILRTLDLMKKRKEIVLSSLESINDRQSFVDEWSEAWNETVITQESEEEEDPSEIEQQSNGAEASGEDRISKLSDTNLSSEDQTDDQHNGEENNYNVSDNDNQAHTKETDHSQEENDSSSDDDQCKKNDNTSAIESDDDESNKTKNDIESSSDDSDNCKKNDNAKKRRRDECESNDQQPASKRSAVVVNSEDNNDFESMINNKLIGDFKIKVKNTVYFVSKNILINNIDAFKEELTENSSKTEIEIKDFEPQAVLEMLRFIYLGKIKHANLIALDLYKLGEKFKINELKKIAEDIIIESLNRGNKTLKNEEIDIN